MKKKQLVRINRLNWDTTYYYDIIKNNGFVITEPATFQLDDKKEKALYGARSILYGTNYEDETAFIERYRCKCGEFKGKMFEHEICPKCEHPVEARDINIEFTGWITLGDNYVLNPFYYNKLADCLGQKVIDEIITAKKVVDLDGNMRTALPEELDENPKHPFIGIGLIDFRKRFVEIMEFFKAKKKKRESEFNRLIKESSSVFCSHIPVYSTFLRPQSSTSDTYYFNSIDKHINPIFSLSEKLKKAEEIDKIFILGRIQNRLNALWNKNFDLLNGKEGHIRGQLLGGSLNFTSRELLHCAVL